jgi:UDP-N-acetyl-D-glucosamine dehydrogenase
LIGIVGLGYVGLPLAVSFSSAGSHVLGFDKSGEKVSKINSGKNYISDINTAELKQAVTNGLLKATTDFSRIAECDAVMICVPTPLDVFKKPDMNYIEAACTDIARNMKAPPTRLPLKILCYR